MQRTKQKGGHTTIRIDREVWNLIVSNGKITETVNQVLRRLLGLDKDKSQQ